MKYELIDTNSNKSLGTVWLENDKIKGSNQHVVKMVHESTSLYTPSESVLFKMLPQAFRNGYIKVKKVES